MITTYEYGCGERMWELGIIAWFGMEVSTVVREPPGRVADDKTGCGGRAELTWSMVIGGLPNPGAYSYDTPRAGDSEIGRGGDRASGGGRRLICAE